MTYRLDTPQASIWSPVPWST